jgi:hypothetical protein
MYCFVFLVKFDGRLPISVLRIEQLFIKNWGLKTDRFAKSSNFENFQIPPFGKKGRSPPWKMLHFFASHFSPGWDRQPAFKFNMNLYVVLIYRLIPRTHGLLGYTASFGITPISRFFKAF